VKAYLLALGLIAQPALALPLGQAAFAPGTKAPAKMVVNDSIWTCTDARCSGPAETRTVAMQRACQTLAREIGAVASLTVGGTTFAPDALAACNEKAGRGTKTVAAR